MVFETFNLSRRSRIGILLPISILTLTCGSLGVETSFVVCGYVGQVCICRSLDVYCWPTCLPFCPIDSLQLAVDMYDHQRVYYMQSVCVIIMSFITWRFSSVLH